MSGSKSTANIFVSLNAEGGDAPEWINLLPAGVIATQDGRGPYTVADMAALAQQSLEAAGGKLPIDENHATDWAAPKGHPSPARGWIVDLQSRHDGMWGRVAWTASGKQLMSEQAYRGISPVFEHDKQNRVLRVLRASLTNTPNLRGLTALHAEGADMDLLVELRKALGLGEDADTTAVIAKVKELNGAAAKAEQSARQLGALAKAAGVAETAEHSVVLNAVSSLSSAATKGADERVAALQSELGTVTQSLTALQSERAKERATAFVDGAIRAGHVGVKPLRDHYIERHAKDPANVEKEIGALPKVETSAIATQRATHAAGADADPVAIAAQATAYQRKMADQGVTVDIAAAVHAVTTKQENAQ